MVEGIHGMAGVAPTQRITKTPEVQAAQTSAQKLDRDKFEMQFQLSKIPAAEQKEIIKDARSNASGWAIFGGLFSTLYYGLRSDKTIADKYGLDVKADKSLVKQIKKEQTLWTLPACIPGLGFLPGIAAWVYNKTMDEKGIKLDGYLR